jgi:hypothetical protein
MDERLEEKSKRIRERVRERKEKLPSIKDTAEPLEHANQEALLRKIQKVSDQLKEETDACRRFLEELRRRKKSSRRRR